MQNKYFLLLMAFVLTVCVLVWYIESKKSEAENKIPDEPTKVMMYGSYDNKNWTLIDSITPIQKTLDSQRVVIQRNDKSIDSLFKLIK